MDFLDPKKERQHRLMLVVGYGLVAIAIGIATLVLLYQSYGYGVDRRGNVLQNGLVFVSSQPSAAGIYLNNELYRNGTNTRMSIVAGNYELKIAKPGYQDWQRPIVVAGGDVQHFDYPFLFPNKLTTTRLQEFSTNPTLGSQSLDRRWILLGNPTTPGTFTLFDMRSSDKPVPTQIALPDGLWQNGDGVQTWKSVEWASDNRHLLLEHTFIDGAATMREFVLLDTNTPAQSVNLTTTLKLPQDSDITLFNNRIAQVYALSKSANTLSRITVADGTVVSKLEHVLAYKSYSDNKILYVSDQSPTGKATPNLVSVVLQDGQETLTLRTLPAGGTYVLNLASYESNWFVAVGASNDAAVYIYKNPQAQPPNSVDTYPAAWRRLNLTSPSYLSFSNNTQYLLAESGQNFVVYDFENLNQFRYAVTAPLDSPQAHASWMDGNRLVMVSGGKLQVLDYDNRNVRSLVSANPAYLPFFSPDYHYLYTLVPGTAGDTKPALTSTSLLVE